MEDRQSGGSRVIAVVGAGRSGTSTATRAVGALGVELGDRLKPGTSKNARGFFEDEELLDINYRLRARFGIRRSGSTVVVIRPESMLTPAHEDLLGEAVEVIRRRFARYPVWGFKSGGTAAFLPFWEEVFRRADQSPGYVLALRNPLAVARSRMRLGARRGVQERSDLEWLARVVPYLRRMLGRPFVALDFDRLLAQPEAELQRMAHKLSLPVTASMQREIQRFAREFLDAKLRHNVFEDADLDTHPRLNPLTRDAYRWLRCLATDELEADSEAFLDDWRRIEETLQTMEPVLRHVEQLEAEVRRSRWSVGGAYHALVHELPKLGPALRARLPV